METRYVTVHVQLPDEYPGPHRAWVAFCSKAEVTMKKLRGQTLDEYDDEPYYWVIGGALYINTDQNKWSLILTGSWEDR